ncbi:PRC-barrel domain-containing protein [Phreatobacter stygius]|nr:PRC-barrel domain-containing protein [Phreatobacter stygius]
MVSKILMTAAAALLLAGGVRAQAPAPAPVPAPAPQTAPNVTPAPGAPAARAPVQPTTLSPGEITVTSVLGVKIYVPKPGTPAANAAANRPSDAPISPTASGAPARNTMILTLSETDWTALREHHDSIGDVNNIVLDNGGRVRQVVLGVGGFLGIGEKAVAVDWSHINWMRDPSGHLLGIVLRTKQQLEAAPRFVDRS